jgi:hypothetical protein
MLNCMRVQHQNQTRPHHVCSVCLILCWTIQAIPGKATKDVASHHKGLQQLSNGEPVPYHVTLRVVQHEGSRIPRVLSATTRKPPGYIRNESGGMFTS